MATFNDATLGTTAGATTPTYSSVESASPRIITVQYGDGYRSRNTFGLNQNPKTYNLTFIVSVSDGDKILAFFDARAKDTASFTFTPPHTSTAREFIADSYRRTNTYLNRVTIQATFEEVFQP
tara:strand:- start:9890 stop:10258 length:369 start_codon:yes stop_codon:yes gene_type:complete